MYMGGVCGVYRYVGYMAVYGIYFFSIELG